MPMTHSFSTRARMFAALAAAWLLALGLSLAWNWRQCEQTARQFAEAEARAAYNKDLVYRRWAARQGGMYVEPSPHTPPNPHLENQPERDLLTASGKQLTLVNPAYMTRQVHQLSNEQYGVQGHITSLTPLNPANAPDPWEEQALRQFTSGASKVVAISNKDGTPHLRAMYPMFTEEYCLKCHARQGYQEGDLRGGISVSVPLQQYTSAASRQQWQLLAVHLIIGLLGFSGLWLSNSYLRRSEQQLRESEERQRSILQTAMDGFLILDGQGCIRETNDTYCQMSGYRREELLGLHIGRLDALESSDDTQQRLAAIRSAGSLRFISQHRRRDGSLFDVESSVQYRPSLQGQMMVFLRDITRENAAQQALALSEERHRRYIDNAPDGVFVTDSSGAFVQVNPAACQMSGYHESELLTMTIADLQHPDYQHSGQEQFARVVQEGQAEAEHPVLTRTGEERWWSVTAIALGTDRTLGFATDITERRKATETLEKRMIALLRPIDSSDELSVEELFNLDDLQRLQDEFAAATGVASLIVHADGRPLTRPSNFCRLCADITRKSPQGRSNCQHSDALIGRACISGPTVQPCLSGGLWDAGAAITVGGRHIASWLIGQVRDASQSEEAMRAYAREIEADEEECIIAFREVPAMSREQFSRIAQVLFTFANQLSIFAYQNVQQARFIAERRQAEQEKEQLQAQLLQIQKMEAIGTLAGGIAHDFNNILSAIIGYAEIARDECPGSSALTTDLEQILLAGHRAKDLVRQILTFSRQHKSERIPLQPATLVKETVKLLRSSLPTTISIAQHIDSQSSAIIADPTQVHQLLMNLCTNAYQAMEDSGGTLAITLSDVTVASDGLPQLPRLPPGRYVKLTVADSGPGITEAIRGRIFDPYFTTKEVGKGSGMGLAIVHGIVNKLGGGISCDSREGQGAVFSVYLPALEGPADTENAPVKEISPRGSERILVVDDEETVATMTQVMLERLGYRVRICADSLEALSHFRRDPAAFDLVITDQTMPGMTGLELARTLLQIRPDLPVMLCSGYSSQLNEKKVQAAGIGAFATKPLSRHHLATLVRQLLDQPAAS